MSVNARLTARDGALLVVDMQEKLLPSVENHEAILVNTIRAIDAAKALDIPVFATEQYPKGLGSTVPALVERLPHRPEKTAFSCCAVPELLEQIHGRGVRHVTLVGIEAHVCVAQTALDLLAMNLHVQIAADAVGSRHRLDWEVALRRLERAGAVISTTEAILFEWTESSERAGFKEISRLIKEADARART